MAFNYIAAMVLYGTAAVNAYFALKGYPESIGEFNAAAVVFTYGVGNLLRTLAARS